MRQDEIPEIVEKRKMFVIVRRDLPPGLRAAQAGHAVAEMCLRHDLAHQWHDDPEGNYLIMLEVANEGVLLEWFSYVKSFDITRELFREPDLAYDATALAALPTPELNQVFSPLSLAYSHRRWWPRFRR